MRQAHSSYFLNQSVTAATQQICEDCAYRATRSSLIFRCMRGQDVDNTNWLDNNGSLCINLEEALPVSVHTMMYTFYVELIQSYSCIASHEPWTRACQQHPD